MNETTEIIGSLLFTSMGHERLSENIKSLSKETTWWRNRTAIISITPEQRGKVIEIGIREPTESWRFLIKPLEIKEREEIEINQPKRRLKKNIMNLKKKIVQRRVFYKNVNEKKKKN
ncbi:hypothetical protein EHI8A_051890 [Entamoeba histolytica HM-1:IMSS-B]|uniref:Uncharacterized protein n=1 Tax=Entamoeba histolytica HM-1:IMSS-B TaxID=885319 RepID=M3S2E1_ENTH1|nr:hypothetical protein EHI8A_051890 [Entamoeba histolytica HM-1:IMSS-B]